MKEFLAKNLGVAAGTEVPIILRDMRVSVVHTLSDYEMIRLKGGKTLL